ncbi:MAG: DUF4349 domain-containing protein [Anaerolineales bacterium]|nr:DUF4349 domain-containing protein [Anaerolineales bacterium]
MFKKIAFLLLVFTLFVTACSPAAMAEVEAPMYALEESVSSERAAYDTGAGFAAPQEFDGLTVDVVSDPAADGEPTNPAGERIVIKNASLSIAVENPAVNLDAVTALADEFGGFVVSSNLYNTTLANGAEVPQANITIRVPAERLDEALTRIKSGAGEILSESISGQDVTREYTDLQSRLTNLQEAETQLQAIMDDANRTEDVINVFNQLTYYREQIEIVKGQIQYYETSAAFSAISVDILADAAVQPLTIGGWEPAGVAKDAIQALINTLQGLVDVTIWLALYILPVALVLLIPLRLIWVAIKRWRKSRRTKVVETPVAS